MAFRWADEIRWAAAAVVVRLGGDRDVGGDSLALSGAWALWVSSRRF